MRSSCKQLEATCSSRLSLPFMMLGAARALHSTQILSSASKSGSLWVACPVLTFIRHRLIASAAQRSKAGLLEGGPPPLAGGEGRIARLPLQVVIALPGGSPAGVLHIVRHALHQQGLKLSKFGGGAGQGRTHKREPVGRMTGCRTRRRLAPRVCEYAHGMHLVGAAVK
jgi:hypothetical protein